MRPVRVLTIAFAALLMMGIFSAAASAVGFETGSAPATVYGTNQSPITLTDSQGVSQECRLQNFETTVSSSKVSSIATKALSCSEGQVSMAGCGLEFQPGSGTVNIGPTGCGPISWINGSGCHYLIPSQAGLSATYVSSGVGNYASVTVHIGSKLKYVDECHAGFLGKANYGGAISGEIVLTSPSGILASKAVGVSVSGVTTPIFSGETTEFGLAGEQKAPKAFQLLKAPSGLGVTCEIARFNSGKAAVQARSLSLYPIYDGCIYNGEPVGPVKMNSCHYQVNNPVFVSEGRYSTSEGSIECTTAGDQIEFELPTLSCLVKIPAQQLKGTQEFENQGSGSERKIATTLGAHEMSYTTVGNTLSCKIAGPGKTGGVMGGQVLLGGFGG